MPKYTPTKFSNLVLRKSGKYFCHAKVHGRKIFKSLGTRSQEIALIRLSDLLASERGLRRSHDRETTVGQLLDEWLAQVKRSKRKPLTIRTIGFIRHHLKEAVPECLGAPVSGCTRDMVAGWLHKVSGDGYCAGAVNRCLQGFRGLFAIAVQSGLLALDPSASLRSLPVIVRERRLPSESQMASLFASLRGARRDGAHYLARFLCYSGMRIGTVRQLLPSHADRKSGFFIVPGELLKTGEPGRTYRFPILPAMNILLGELDARYGTMRVKLVPARTGWATIRRHCELLKIPVMSHHSFRHYFSSTALAAGVPVPVVAHWRGDRDGGKTLLRVYWHLIDETSRRYAAQMKLP